MRGRYVVHLDLMCCGFAGAVLLFLIIAAARPPVPVDRMLVVRCRVVGNDPGAARAELGIEYRPPDSKGWERATTALRGGRDAEPFFFSAKAEGSGGNVAVLVWRTPRPGRYAFRPYLADTAALRGAGVPAPLPVRTTVLGPGDPADPDPPDRLTWPGDAGAAVFVTVVEE